MTVSGREERALIVHGVNCLYIKYLSWVFLITTYIRSKELSDSAYDTQTLLETQECNNIDWLLMMSLNQVLKEKDELGDWNSQIKQPISGLSASSCSRSLV